MERRSFNEDWKIRLAEYGGGFGPDDDVLAIEAARIARWLSRSLGAPERPP